MISRILLLELDLREGTAQRVHRLCTASHDVTWNGNTFLAVGDLLEVDNLQQTCEVASLGTTITLSGIDPNYRAEIDTHGFNNAPIKLYSALVEEGVVTEAVVIHSGFCDTPLTEIDYESGVMTIGVATQSIWKDLEAKPDLMRSSFATHSATHCYDKFGNYSPDQFYKFVASTATEEDWISK